MKKFIFMLVVVLALGLAFVSCNINSTESLIITDFITLTSEDARANIWKSTSSFYHDDNNPVNAAIKVTAGPQAVIKAVFSIRSGTVVEFNTDIVFDPPITDSRTVNIGRYTAPVGSYIAEVYVMDSEGYKSNTRTATFTIIEGRTEIVVDESVPVNCYITIPTAEQEADRLIAMFSLYHSHPWSIDNQYPNHPLINSLKNKVAAGGALTSSDQAQVRQLVINELYNRDDYLSTYASINRLLRVVDQQVLILAQYKEKWGFFMPERYNIQLTSYLPVAGTIDQNGVVYKTHGNDFNDQDAILGTILHEITHFGINDVISKRYNLPFWTNERLTDLFTFHVNKKVIPDYVFSYPEDDIDVIFENPDVLDRLPYYIEQFMKNR